jgi:hypothetical protein
MAYPKTVHWNLPISPLDFEKLRGGFEPLMMEDKWEVKSTYFKESNTYCATWTRSWTDTPFYALILRRNLSKSTGPIIESMVFESFTYADIHITAEMAKKEVVWLARGVLACDIKAFPEIDIDEVFNYPLQDSTDTELAPEGTAPTS